MAAEARVAPKPVPGAGGRIALWTVPIPSRPWPASFCTSCGAGLGDPVGRFCPACGVEVGSPVTPLRRRRAAEGPGRYGGWSRPWSWSRWRLARWRSLPAAVVDRRTQPRPVRLVPRRARRSRGRRTGNSSRAHYSHQDVLDRVEFAAAGRQDPRTGRRGSAAGLVCRGGEVLRSGRTPSSAMAERATSA